MKFDHDKLKVRETEPRKTVVFWCFPVFCCLVSVQVAVSGCSVAVAHPSNCKYNLLL